MREFLITKFVCAKCGDNLELTYDKPSGAVRHADGEPTGAAKVEQVVVVEPCRRCLEPLENVRRAIGVLKELT